MIHRKSLLLLAIVGVVMLASRPALAQSRSDGAHIGPEDLARLCVMEITGLAERCIQLNHRRTAECVQVIRHLLENGQVEQAHAVAARCIETITEDTILCLWRIRHLTERCVHILVSHHHPGLAHHVAHAARRAMYAVVASRNHAVEIIRAQFDGAGDGGL